MYAGSYICVGAQMTIRFANLPADTLKIFLLHIIYYTLFGIKCKHYTQVATYVYNLLNNRSNWLSFLLGYMQ